MLAAVANRGEIRKSLTEHAIDVTGADHSSSHSSMLLTPIQRGSHLRAIGLTDLPYGKTPNSLQHPSEYDSHIGLSTGSTVGQGC